MPYCENCGWEVSPSAKFCRKCGAAQETASVAAQPVSTAPVVAPAPATPAPPPVQPSSVAQTTPVQQSSPQLPLQTPVFSQPSAASGETVLGLISLRRPKSLGRYDSFTGVVTNQRMIFAQLNNEIVKQEIETARSQAKAEGKGFFGQWKEQLKASSGQPQRYFSMTPSAILQESPGNYSVENKGISEIKIKHRDVMRNGEVYEREFEMELHSLSGTYTFKMNENDQYIQLLKQVYGERVKMPFGYFSSHGVGVRIGF